MTDPVHVNRYHGDLEAIPVSHAVKGAASVVGPDLLEDGFFCAGKSGVMHLFERVGADMCYALASTQYKPNDEASAVDYLWDACFGEQI